ncbi:MAG: hypothetical protein SFY92_07445 [Verrucomicrobiae bacterium]|nr:hypothetical protein [Verrucomicrobiae bacterium]
MKTLLPSLLTLLLLLSPVLLVAESEKKEKDETKPETISAKEVSALILDFEADPLGDKGKRAAALILDFANTSEEVQMTLGKHVLPWYGKITDSDFESRDTLMLAYISGNIKSQLKNKKPADDPYAGWVQVFLTYRQLQKRNPKLVIAEVEELLKVNSKGQLRSFADKTLREGDRPPKESPRL